MTIDTRNINFDPNIPPSRPPPKPPIYNYNKPLPKPPKSPSKPLPAIPDYEKPPSRPPPKPPGLPAYKEENFETGFTSKDSLADRIKTVKFEYKVGDVTLFETNESAERCDTFEIYIKGLKGKLTHLEKLPSKDEKIATEIAKLKTKLLSAQLLYDKGARWASPNTPREAAKIPEQETLPIPTLINLRRQTVTVGNEECSAVNRSGAVSDFYHGHISLKEMMDYENLLKLEKGDVGDNRSELATFYNLLSHNEINRKKISKLVRNIKEQVIESYQKQYPGILKEETFNETLKQIISDRKEHLQTIVMQDLATHFKNKPAVSSNVVYGRVALLDITKKSYTKDGFTMNERTQALDTKAIYDSLNDATITFDQKKGSDCVFIDHEGVIHMPVDYAKNEVKETHLNTLFYNVSVQGKTKNKGIQKAINDSALLKSKSLVDTFDVQKKLEKHSKFTFADPFNLAETITSTIQKIGYASVNCFGGKDRTGYLLALITKRNLENKLMKQANISSEKAQELLATWSHELLSQNSIAVWVVKDCAGHIALKLTRADLELYQTTSSLKGVALRVEHYWNAVKILFKKTPKSESPGQLFVNTDEKSKEKKA